MALIWADGFAHWGTLAQMQSAGYQFAGGSQRLQNDPGYARTGNWFLQWQRNGGMSNNVFIRFNIPAVNIATVGFATRWDVLDGDANVPPRFTLGNVSVTFPNSGTLEIRVGGNLVFTSDPNTFKSGTWNYVELQIDTTVTRVTLRLNNVVIANVVNATANVPVNLFQWDFSVDPYFALCRGWNISDLYVTRGDVPGLNPGFLGDVRCRTLFPNAVGPDQDWTTTGAATPMAALDNVPVDPGQYIAGAVVGDVSDFEFDNVPDNTSYVAGLMSFSAMSKTDAGTCEVTPQITSGDATDEAPAIAPAVAPAYYTSVFEREPGSQLYWTRQTVNALRFGFRRSL